MITLTQDQWTDLKNKLSQEHPVSVMSIRYRMREVLGFTVREHKKWVSKSVDDSTGKHYGFYEIEICLDFYNDAQESWFHLKYM